MAYLNKAERDALLAELKDKRFDRARRILTLKDDKVRLAYYRNVQETDRWMTRYILPTLGVQVTLVEKLSIDRMKKVYTLHEIIVEPTADNRL